MTNTHDDFETGLERKSARDTLTQLLGPEVIASLHRRSDAWGWFGIAGCWATIALALFMSELAIDAFTWWSLPLLIVSITLIGGRILGLAILSHEGSHRSLFETQKFNDSVCNWLCAAPIFLDIAKYRRHHALHHVHTGTE
ncbi:fatty acid desaturase, partial [Thalassolituus oleivorans]